MRHRFAFGGTIVASVALFLSWILLSPNPLSAMERTAQAIRKTKSFQCDVGMEVAKEIAKEGVKPLKGRMYRQTGMLRNEMLDGDKVISVDVRRTDKPGLFIDHRTKTYRRTNPINPKVLAEGQSPLATFELLGKFSGEADEDLGSKRIGSIEARGFRIASNKVDPDLRGGTMTVWVAPDSNLPVLVLIQSTLLGGTMRLENFLWDVDFSPELFELRPPSGYEDKTAPPPDPDEQVSKITAALKIYADAFGGHYPRVRMVYGDVTSAELSKQLGIPSRNFDYTKEAVYKHEAFPRYLEAASGFAWINGIQRDNPDSGYFGKTVGRKDAEKVLFYWKLDDGDYRVIYGGLKSENLAEDRLRRLLQQK